MLKRILVVVGVVITIMLGAAVFTYINVIFQEGDPIPIMKAIFKLNQENTAIVKLSDNPERYIIKSKSGNQPFVELMNNEGYTFSEQIGSGLIFEKGGNIVVATTKSYTRFYEIIRVKGDAKKYLNESVTLKEELPKDFGMVFKYGVNAKNELDTFSGKYTKDMIIDPSISVNLKLNKEQLQIIYNKMLDIGFFDYPSNFDPSDYVYVTPFETYYFKVMVNGKVKELTWKDEHLSQGIKAKKLRELIQLITIMVQSSPEYQLLPMPRGGYM